MGHDCDQLSLCITINNPTCWVLRLEIANYLSFFSLLKMAKYLDR